MPPPMPGRDGPSGGMRSRQAMPVRVTVMFGRLRWHKEAPGFVARRGLFVPTAPTPGASAPGGAVPSAGETPETADGSGPTSGIPAQTGPARLRLALASSIPARITRWRVTRVSARVTRGVGTPRGQCRVERLVKRRWQVIARSALNGRGVCVMRIRFGRVGTERLRVSFAGRPGVGSVTGRTVNVRVVRAPR